MKSRAKTGKIANSQIDFRQTVLGKIKSPEFVIFLISVFLPVLLFRLVYFDTSQNLVTHNFGIWGDWAAHFTFISQFLNRGWSWILGDNPLLAGAPFQYPWLSHALTASLAKLTSFLSPNGNANDPVHFIQVTRYTSALFLFLIPWGIFRLLTEFNIQKKWAALGVILFIFLGGVQVWLEGNPSYPVTNHPTRGPYIAQILLFEFLPQRAFTFAIVLATLLLTWHRKLTKNEQPISFPQALILTLGFCSLAWLHVHTWLAIALFLLVDFLLEAISKKSISKNSKKLYVGMAVALISGLMLWFLLLRNPVPPNLQHSWSKFHLGFGNPPENFLWFWIKETSIFLPLAAWGSVILARSRSPSWNLVATGWTLFLLCNVVQFQPSYFDNLKLFTYSFLFLVPAVLSGLQNFVFYPKQFRIILVIALIASGARDTIFFWTQPQTAHLYTHAEIELARGFLKNPAIQELKAKPKGILSLSEPEHNHWLSNLTGTPVYMGYPGWLWSWGLNYTQHEQKLKQALNEIRESTPKHSTQRSLLDLSANIAVFKNGELHLLPNRDLISP